MKLRHFGLGGSLASYLQNRIQQVRVGTYRSDELSITSGVPQGSVVGSLFFLNFIIDLPDFCTCTLFLLADDLKLASFSLFTLQSDLLSLLTWSKNNKLDFNFKKTSLLNIRETSVKCDHPVLFMENDMYLKNESIRNLGVIVSANLTWTSHVNSKIANCYQRLAILRRNLPKYPNPEIKFKLYRVYILPALTYASGVWYPNRGDLKKPKKLQRICFKWRLTTNSSIIP